MFICHSIARNLALIALVLLLSGCGSDRLATYPVNGQVLYNGKPFKGATVAFHPVDPKNNTGFPPNGKTDEEGRFQLSTYLTNDGCPAGEWRVAIAVEVESVEEGSDQTKRIGFQLPAKYHKVETSDLKVTIKPGSNQLEPFQLQGPAVPKTNR